MRKKSANDIENLLDAKAKILMSEAKREKDRSKKTLVLKIDEGKFDRLKIELTNGVNVYKKAFFSFIQIDFTAPGNREIYVF